MKTLIIKAEDSYNLAPTLSSYLQDGWEIIIPVNYCEFCRVYTVTIEKEGIQKIKK